MGVKKEKKNKNGIATVYHRIAMVIIDVDVSVRLLVRSYLSEEDRDFEKAYCNGEYDDVDPREITFPYTESVYYTLPYDEKMSVKNAYKELKKMDAFKNAIDC